MINLTNTTFIIPVRIDSSDRLSNLEYVIKYLQFHFETNIIIQENSTDPQVPEILEKIPEAKAKPRVPDSRLAIQAS